MARQREHPAAARERRAAIDDPNIVLEAGLRFLEVRPRSIAEVRRRLGRAGYREELVSRAIERLTDLGMLDDEAFAAQWVESRDRASPRGEHALMLELRQKGIEAPIIASILRARREEAVRWDDGVSDDDGASITPDEAGARMLLARHARALARVPDLRQRRQKAYALLARRGFGPEIAGRLAASVLAGTEDEPGDAD
jgi:regulatory protein